MLKEPKLKTLLDLVESATPEELIWINGYLSGVVANASRKEKLSAGKEEAAGVKKISLVYGTETGNAKRLATQLAATGKKKGLQVKLTALDQYRLSELEKEEYFFVVISTQGEGEPPAPAKKFYDHIHQQSLKLEKLKYSVLALGDSSYPFFCKTGEDVDSRFQSLGARPLVVIQKCDVDYEEDAGRWFEQVLEALQREGNANAASTSAKTISTAASAGSRKIYEGRVITNINLNDRGSAKETWHIEISTDEVIDYQPGDALGVVPVNRKEVVDRILALSDGDEGEIIETPRAKGSIRELLTQHLNICYLPASVIKQYAGITAHEIPDIRMDLVDLLRIYPVQQSSQLAEIIKILTPIAPRLYSISSSPAAHGETEVHLTVSKNSFLTQDEQRFGLCSEFLGDLPAGATLRFYIHKNKNFRLPAGDRDVLMIGPGTGIAPFRSFLAERNANGDEGKNWLFFGEQHFVTDFLYQTEMQEYVETGVLTRLSLAFSRDQAEKIYVQHRLLQQATEVYQWLQSGAVLYICGAKEPMCRDVEEALVQIIQEQGGKTPEQAHAYLEELETEERYHKDVY